MIARRSLLVAAALLTAAGCSAATAEVTSPPTDDATETTGDTTLSTDSSTETTGDTTSSTDSSTEATGDATSSTDSSIDSTTSTTDDATTTQESTTTSTTEEPTTTTTVDTVVPVRLPDREIPEIAPMETPLQAAGTSSGDATHAAQWRLLELGFWVENANGQYDNTTQQAVMAFQKYYGLEADGVLGPITAEALSQVAERPQGTSTTGTLVEVDKSKQLVFLIEDGVAKWILNTSTGTEVPYDEINKNTGEPERGDSVTRTGVFAVNRERAEGWWAGDLGEIYRPKYFTGGIALHGSNYIPAYPASHGCVRVSTDAMDWIWDNDLVPMGTTVWVHGEIPA
jgi:peptidoglycan hydrolase-like protein with peptidoglycan-binding domain